MLINRNGNDNLHKTLEKSFPRRKYQNFLLNPRPDPLVLWAHLSLLTLCQCFLTMYHNNCWVRIVALYLEACWRLVSTSGRVMYMPTTVGLLLASAVSIF